MGSKFVTSVGFDLQEIFEESDSRKPLIFILSPGNCYNVNFAKFELCFSTKLKLLGYTSTSSFAELSVHLYIVMHR